MRWALTMSGEHGEGLESRVRFEGIVEEFAGKLEANGYLRGFSDYSLDVEGDLAATLAKFDAPTEDWDWTELPEEVPEGVVEPTLGERIAQLQAARGAGEHLSQREMAEILGVTRYQIKKALG